MDAQTLKKLKGWIYLHAPSSEWGELGFEENEVMKAITEPQEATVVAITIVTGLLRGKEQMEARHDFWCVARELMALGVTEEELKEAVHTVQLTLEKGSG